jgi:hypothetical protein
MQVIKLYLPMKDNDGNDLMSLHDRFINDIRDVRENGNVARISGFTRFQAEGFWFDGEQAYVDDIKIYEFHVENKHFGGASAYLWNQAYQLCNDMKQECIYLQLNNDTELVRYK